MNSISIKEINSKKACYCCKQKKLLTNDMEDIDEIIHYHCLNCGYEFCEGKEQRQLEELKSNNNDHIPWNSGAVILLAMIITVFVINMGEQTENRSRFLHHPRHTFSQSSVAF
jgi:hypothetical protein